MTLIQKTLSFLYGPLPKKILYSVALLTLITLLVFCIFYISSDYEHLTRWYLSLNDSFYKKDTWTSAFFTPAVKMKGNTLAGAGIVLVVFLSFSIIRSWQSDKKKKVFITPHAADPVKWGWYAGVAALALVLGIWSWTCAAPCYDEIFSAVNCVELHPFQTISYYMLPNNHLYFNFLNNILFSWWGDPVQSGRLISLAAYTGILLAAFHWLYSLIHNHLYSFVALLPIAFQLTVVGMSAQARGYEVQLLCAWVSLITMLRYTQTGSDRMLRINTLFNILGFIMVSTYLLFYAAQALVVLSVMAYDRRFRWRYLRSQLITAAAVFLFYLPAFCFSGTDAFFNNPYVTPAFPDWLSYMAVFSDVTRFFINFCFSMLCGEDRAINFILFFLPLALFFSRRRERRVIALAYVMLWIMYVVITLHMRRNPFNRNMIMHYSLTMGFVVFTFYSLVRWGAGFLPSAKARLLFITLFFGAPVVAFTGYLALTDKRDISVNLYSYDVNPIWKDHTTELLALDRNASIWCADESFYMYYILKKHHFTVHHNASAREDYFILRHGEPFPAGKESDYMLIRTVTQDYEFYKRK